MDKIEQLREELKSFDVNKLTVLLRELNITMDKEQRPKRVKVDHGPIKAYTTVVKDFKCLTCGTCFSTEHNFVKGEDTACLDKDGRTHIIRLTGKEGVVKLQCFTSRCTYCESVVRYWDRSELERRFIKLLDSTTIKEVIVCNEGKIPEEKPKTVHFTFSEEKREEEDYGSGSGAQEGSCDEAQREV